jgi:hypothetical protein
MSLNHHQRHQLHRIEWGLLRSDPHLAAMLAVFGQLSADQRMPAWEQLPGRPDRVRHAAASIAKMVAVLAAAIGLLFAAVRALLTAVVVRDRARPASGARQQVGPGTETGGRPDPAAGAD